MLNLYRTKVTIALFFLLTTLTTFGQRNRMNDIIYQQDYDVKTVHFGYYLGPHSARYSLKFNQQFQVAQPSQQNPSYLITSPSVLGMWRFGGVVNFYVNDKFDVQTCLGASIYDRQIRFYKLGGSGTTPDIDRLKEGNTAWVDFPVHLKYKSNRRRNTRMYLMAGARYAAEIGQTTKKGGINAPIIQDKKRNDFMIEYGVGLEKFTPFAKVTPELCFSHGMINQFTVSNQPNRRGLVGMNSNTVTLFIYFE